MSNLVELPLHIKWSPPLRPYDLDDPADRLLVYEYVLREGADDDIRRFVDTDVVLALWTDLVLPPGTRRAWYDYFTRERGVDPETASCSPRSRRT